MTESNNVLERGQRVQHYSHGWTGLVAERHERNPGEYQGGLVTVERVQAGSDLVFRPITVTHDELEEI
jgi:hypothetical protein